MQRTSSESAAYIDSNSRLADCCQQWNNKTRLALDTEFVRTNTFYPRLGLLQVADNAGCYLIDPLTIDDWDCFTALFENEAICFVLHSCGEDLNLFASYFKILPRKIFDTQIAAAFLDTGFSISYQGLVDEVLDIQLPKSETRSDWLQRPLSELQLTYAAADVAHLLELHDHQIQRLRDRGLESWFDAECQDMLLLAATVEERASWQSLYTTVSNSWRLDDAAILRLQRLCIWRELESRARDKPRNWIARDADLYLVAREIQDSDSSIDQLHDLSLDKRMINRYGKKILAALSDESLASEPVDRSLLNTPLTGAQRKLLKQCQVLVRDKAQQHAIAPEILGRKRWLMDIIQHHRKHGSLNDSELGRDWRLQILNPELAEILKPAQPSGAEVVAK